jgi:hypothetical protein
MPDPPCQPALAGAARRQYDGELRRDVDIFGDNLHPAVRYVRDRAIPWQRSDTELDLCEIPAHATLALTSIHEHVDPSPHSDGRSSHTRTSLPMNCWNLPSGISRNVCILFGWLLPNSADRHEPAGMNASIKILPRRGIVLRSCRAATRVERICYRVDIPSRRPKHDIFRILAGAP